MKALSVIQPWAWLIAAGHKRVENRDWSPGDFRGPLAIHASKTAELGLSDSIRALVLSGRVTVGTLVDNARACGELAGGAIVGIADDVEAVRLGHFSVRENPFAFGPWCWVFHKPVRRLRNPIPCRGALGLWEVPAGVLEALRAQGVAA